MPSTERSSSPLPAFLTYLVTIFLAAALLSPPIHALLSPVYPASPGRYFRRVLELSALLLFFVFRKRMGIRSWGDVGVSRPVLRPFLWGCLLGLASGIICLLPLFLASPSGPRAGIRWDLSSFATWMGRGLLIALTEELLFRGIFFTILLRGLRRFPGILASSLLFCLAHYLRAPSAAAEASPSFFSGWELLYAHLTPILSLSWFDVQGLLLFVVGAALATAYLATGTIWMPIGIHALWVALLHGLAAKSDSSPSGFWSPFVIALFGVFLWIGFGRQRLGRGA